MLLRMHVFVCAYEGATSDNNMVVALFRQMLSYFDGNQPRKNETDR